MSFELRGVWVLWASVTFGAAGDWPPEVWTRPTDPFHIDGPVYYVGSRELTAYLLVDEAGLVLINVGMQENVPLVFASIRKLGFDPQRIRYLLITQAHMDHAGGAALVREETGAVVLAGVADVPLLQRGGLEDHVFADRLPFKPVTEPRGLRHGERVVCGKLSLETIAIPGHTPGSSSWLLRREKPEPVRMLFLGSLSVLPDARLIENPIYPTVVDDFRTSYRRLESVRADYVFPDHFMFAHPPGVTHEDKPRGEWFKRPELLTAQIDRSRKALERNLKQAAETPNDP
ncbi:MAG: MBL fold metallo-hydrolase [Acidobacteriota bacterium]|nr:MBL fold metallo-hydrolase [Acidobacteriota bacterium]